MTDASDFLARPRFDDCEAKKYPDEIVVRKATWDQYERLLARRGERPMPRIAYLEGIEIATTSMPHEWLQTKIRQLVEVWCLERGIDFKGAGRRRSRDRGSSARTRAARCRAFRPASN